MSPACPQGCHPIGNSNCEDVHRLDVLYDVLKMDQVEKFPLGDQQQKCVGVGVRAQAQSLAYSERDFRWESSSGERKLLFNIFLSVYLYLVDD